MKNKIRELRESAGFTQEGFAQRVQVTRQTIISLEKGKYSNPSVFLAWRIAKELGKGIEEVFIFSDER